HRHPQLTARAAAANPHTRTPRGECRLHPVVIGCWSSRRLDLLKPEARATFGDEDQDTVGVAQDETSFAVRAGFGTRQARQVTRGEAQVFCLEIGDLQVE